MRPTPRADALIGPAREALALLRGLASEWLRIRSEVGIPQLPHLHDRCQPRDDAAPPARRHAAAAGSEVRLDALPISATTAHVLETGDADLALGFVPGLDAGFHAQQLYMQDFICLVNAKHPRIGTTFTARAYKEEAHIGILSSASYPMLQSALQGQRINRRVQLEMPGFLGVAAIVSSTDLIATVPRTIGEELARSGSVRVFPCPVKVPSFPVKQYWHTRYHHDPGLRWLRGVCARLFMQSGPARDRTKGAA